MQADRHEYERLSARQSPYSWALDQDESMSDAPAWTALGLSVVNSVTLIVGAQRRRRRRNAAGPTADIRRVLTQARNGLQHLTAIGGESSDWFLAPDRKDTDRRLSDLAQRRDDEQLRRLLDDTAAAWRECFALSPPPRDPRVYSGGEDPESYGREDADSARRKGDVAAAARGGMEVANRALHRLNDLERRLL